MIRRKSTLPYMTAIHAEDDVEDKSVDLTAEQVAGSVGGNPDNSTAGDVDDIAVDIRDGSPVPLFKQKENRKRNETKQENHPIHHFDVLSFYQENFGMVSAYVQKDMLYWIETKGEEMVLYAMKRALEQNKPTWGYAKGILHTWVKRGIMTIQHAEDDDEAFRNRSRDDQSRWRELSAEVVPDWFHERKKQKGKKPDNQHFSIDHSAVEEEAEDLEVLLKKLTGNKREPGEI